MDMIPLPTEGLVIMEFSGPSIMPMKVTIRKWLLQARHLWLLPNSERKSEQWSCSVMAIRPNPEAGTMVTLPIIHLPAGMGRILPLVLLCCLLFNEPVFATGDYKGSLQGHTVTGS